MKECHHETPILGNIIEGGDHGFDCEMTIEEDWIKKGCEFMVKYWI
jgi:hypothetical protein